MKPLLMSSYDRIRDHPEVSGAGDFRDLSALFRYETKALFLDHCHLSEEGNRRVAERMAEDVRALFAK